MLIHYIFKYVMIIGICLICISCGSSNDNNDSQETFIIEAKPSIVTLFYSDFINPIRTIAVRNTEADGVVIEKKFEYGKTIKKGQLLFVISSQQLSKNYYEALRQFVKSAETFATAQYQMEGVEYLNKLKIISKQEYNTTQSQLFNAKLDYTDSTYRLRNILEQEGIDVSILTTLSSKKPQEIYNILSNLPKTNIFEVFSPASGIALLPNEEGGGGKSGQKGPVLVGNNVKSNQELLIIGDMSGISVTVKLSETYIDKVKEGQKAIITGDAFPGITLEGKVVTVGRQAISDSNRSDVPSFAVTVNVPTITEAALNKIRVGMSADVAFPLENPPTIKVPFSAIFKKNDQDYVKKIDPSSGKIIEIPIKTGRTELKEVQVIQGLKDKDEVIIDASSN